MLTALRTQYSVGNIVSDYAVPIGGISDFVVEVNDAVWERDSFELRQMNVARLQEMGVAKEEADAFLDSEVISPSVQTLMISGLDRLGAIRGRDRILDQSRVVETEDQARYDLSSVAMLAWVTGENQAITSLTQHGPVSMAFASWPAHAKTMNLMDIRDRRIVRPRARQSYARGPADPHRPRRRDLWSPGHALKWTTRRSVIEVQIILPARHPQQDLADDGKVTEMIRVHRNVSDRPGRQIELGNVFGKTNHHRYAAG